ncbi:MAG: hypothetical protein MI862_28980 [Desulfobacterales bacterium]|nr:hypothetical protein [Desulfobacterales bacterium]
MPGSDTQTTLYYNFSTNPLWEGKKLQLRIDLEGLENRGVQFTLSQVSLIGWPVSLLSFSSPSLPPVTGQDFHFNLSILNNGEKIRTVDSSRGLSLITSPHSSRIISSNQPAAYKLNACDAGIHNISISGINFESLAEIWIRDHTSPSTSFGRFKFEKDLLILHEDATHESIVLRIIPEIRFTLCEHDKIIHISLPLRLKRYDESSVLLQGERQINTVILKAEMAVSNQSPNRCTWQVNLESSGHSYIADIMLPRFLPGAPESRSQKSLSLLPGVEMLAGQTLPASDSFYPPASKVTWPCAYMEQKEKKIAISWNGCDSVTPAFAAPDTLSGLSLHTLYLTVNQRSHGHDFINPLDSNRLPLEIKGEVWNSRDSRGRILASIGDSMVGTGLNAPKVLPALEKSVSSIDTTFKGHLGLTRRSVGSTDEYFDPRSCISFHYAHNMNLAGFESAALSEIESFQFTESGCNLPFEIGLMFPDYLEIALKAMEMQVGKLCESQHPDGSWPARIPNGGQLKDPETSVMAAASIAKPLLILIPAYMMGLCPRTPIEKALALLDDKTLLPTGGQPWEFSPSVPELISLYFLVQVWILAYEAGLYNDGLERSMDCLSTGLTFVNLNNSCYGHGADALFSCTAALGITRASDQNILWYQHAPDDQRDWRGLCCPWVGSKFACAIEKWLNAFECNGKRDDKIRAFFKKMSNGVFTHMTKLLRDDGSIPDGFDFTLNTETEPLYIPPFDMAWHGFYLLNAPPDYVIVKHNELTVAGMGKFQKKAGIIEFTPSVPCDQAILVFGNAIVSEKNSSILLKPLRYGLNYAIICGTTPVTIRSSKDDDNA